MSDITGVKIVRQIPDGDKRIQPGHGVQPRKNESIVQEDEPSAFQSFSSKASNVIKSTINLVCFLNPINFYCIAKKVNEVFSPFINLVNGLDNPASKETKITAKEYAETLDNVLSQITSDKALMKGMTEKSRETLMELKKTVIELEQRKDLQDLDMTELIHQWRHKRNTEALFELAARFKSSETGGKFPRIIDRRMRSTFAEVLESLAKANEKILSHPPSRDRDRAHEHIVQAADSAVDASEVVIKKGSDEKLTKEDKQFISQKLENTAKHVKIVTEDKTLSRYVAGSYPQLCELINMVMNYVRWLDESQKEDEKQHQKELCKERHQEKKEIKQLLQKYQFEKRLANEFYYRMENVKRKMMQLSREAKNAKKEFGLSSGKHKQFLNEFREIVGDYFHAEKMFKQEIGREYSDKEEIQEISALLPPSYVCGKRSLFNLELDLIC